MIGSLWFCFIAPSKEFQGGHQCWYKETEHGIHPADMSELVGVGKVPTIPGYQKVALVIRGKGQVQRITTRISRHQFVPDIPLDDLNNGQLDGEEWQITNESQSFRATLGYAVGEFV